MADVLKPIIEANDPPASCLTGAPVVLGIDEAGRGPVLGSMVYACAYWPQSEDKELGAMGFDDSKALTEARREALFERLRACGRIGYVIIHLKPEDISAKMLQRTPYSLNAMSHDTAADLVRRVVAAGVNVASVFVDTVGDADYYRTKLSRQFGHRIAFTVQPKADSAFKCVSAASICAKVARDRSLRDWVFREPALAAAAAAAAAVAVGGAATSPTTAHEPAASALDDDDISSFSGASDDDDSADDDGGARAAGRVRGRSGGVGSGVGDGVGAKRAKGADGTPVSGGGMGARLLLRTAGSGYPGDPLTKAWMAANMDPIFGWPSVARFSWAPAKDALKDRGAACAWDDDEEGGGSSGGGGAGGGGRPQSKLLSFFSASSSSTGAGGGTGLPVRHKFFTARGMQHVTSL